MTMTTDAPHPIGLPKEVSITGALIPWDVDQPHFLTMPGSDFRYLPCFSAIEKLQTLMEALEITNYTVKQIDDGMSFLSSVSGPENQNVRVILDAHFVEGGRVRFTQVVPTSS